MNKNAAAPTTTTTPIDLGFLVSLNEVDPTEAVSVELTVRAILAEAVKRIELETGYPAHVSGF